MKSRFKKLIIVAAAFALSMLVLCACNKGGERGFEYLVTFDYNLGTEIDANIENQYLGLNGGDKIYVKPGDAKAAGWLDERVIDGVYVDGWYLPALGDDGQPLVGEDGRVVLGQAWNFDDAITGDVTLYAGLKPNTKLRVVLPGGELVKEYDGRPGSTVRKPERGDSSAPSLENKTFYGFYADEALSEPFVWGTNNRYTFGTADETIYARFIDGVWNIITTPEEFTRYVSGENCRLFIDNDIDFTNTRFSSTEYSGWRLDGEINGNGKKLIGIKRAFQFVQRSREGLSIFSELTARANIHDLIVEGAEVSIEFIGGSPNTATATFALFADKIHASAKVQNVTVSGTLKIGEYKQSGSTTNFGAATLEKFAARDDRAEKSGYDDSRVEIEDANAAAA